MASTLIRGLDYLSAYFQDCVAYDGGFMDDILVAAFYLGVFTYVAVVSMAMYHRNWTNAVAALGLFVTDYVVELTYLVMPRVPQFETPCDPHEYDRPSHNVATCAYVMVFFMAYGAWARDSQGWSVLWRMTLLMGNVIACAAGELLLRVRNPHEIVSGGVVGMLMGGLSALLLALVVAPQKHTPCVKRIGRLLCVEDPRVLYETIATRQYWHDARAIEPESSSSDERAGQPRQMGSVRWQESQVREFEATRASRARFSGRNTGTTPAAAPVNR